MCFELSGFIFSSSSQRRKAKERSIKLHSQLCDSWLEMSMVIFGQACTEVWKQLARKYQFCTTSLHDSVFPTILTVTSMGLHFQQSFDSKMNTVTALCDVKTIFNFNSIFNFIFEEKVMPLRRQKGLLNSPATHRDYTTLVNVFKRDSKYTFTCDELMNNHFCPLKNCNWYVML